MDFYTEILGGTWTAKHKHVVSDAVVGLARAGMPKTWCKLYKWPKQMAVYYSKYGRVESEMLAKEWCRRSQHFY